jgi:drug/metabolite transporter (DMT)-like permease
MRAVSFGPYLCLLLIIGLLGTVTPVMKAVFDSSHVDPVTVATLRTLIAFVILFPIAACRDHGAIKRLARRDLVELSALGALGIGSYLVAATGLYYTTVTHYVLIYSLLPGWTAVFMALLRHRRLTPLTVAGIALSFLGCALAVTTKGMNDVGLSMAAGDGLVLLFTIMLALHLVGSRDITKRVGTLTSTTVMFGSTALLMIAEACAWAAPVSAVPNLSTLMALGYIGVATAAVFLLRAQALKSLAPTTVASFHNLIPVCTLVVADLWLEEPLQGPTLFGAAIILTGLELLRRAHLNPRIVHTESTELPTIAPCQLAPVHTPAIKTA